MSKAGKAGKWAARTARLSVALRENLKKRKAQAKARKARGRDRDTAETFAAAAPLPGEGPDFRRNQGAN